MKIILLRHGQTDFNKRGIHMGQIYDVPINDVGKAQVEERVDEIRALEPELIISSPLRRTAGSAEIVGEVLGMPVELDDRLIEINLGSLSGESNINAANMMGMSLEEFVKAYRSGTYDYSSHAGESAREVEIRARDFFGSLKKRSLERVLIVCHGGFLRMLHYVITNKLYPVGERVPNAALVTLDYE